MHLNDGYDVKSISHLNRRRRRTIHPAPPVLINSIDGHVLPIKNAETFGRGAENVIEAMEQVFRSILKVSGQSVSAIDTFCFPSSIHTL